ncbi:MAG: nucleoside deaminase [Gammaproteobacteria bacterium]|nr:nucleoside deaminase [Gammaproteobacteria bacterium]MCW8839808.1 nucleoside deaminase [Gammaproteobacteria bacterium]MCW8927203.1 nucleoside deaminase [Gammaproteobacteria bacterium]MCW8957728.1 nucleoside deaminase [Gammaproteobacteria bacterium]MCW8973938.1 nucleoside deaminase [Gammaproteobacteria bacterium]
MDEDFLRETIRLADESIANGGGPFGAVVVRGGEIVGRGNNRVTLDNDPTAHAEVRAIRDACRTLGDFQLSGCELYVNCEPCPMCLSAAYWARLDAVWYAAEATDAAAVGFDDALIREELQRPPAERRLPMRQALRDEALETFRRWQALEEKIEY